MHRTSSLDIPEALFLINLNATYLSAQLDGHYPTLVIQHMTQLIGTLRMIKSLIQLLGKAVVHH